MLYNIIFEQENSLKLTKFNHAHQCEYAGTALIHEQVEDAQAGHEAMARGPQLVVGHIDDGEVVAPFAINLAPQVVNAEIRTDHWALRIVALCIELNGQVHEVDDESQQLGV